MGNYTSKDPKHTQTKMKIITINLPAKVLKIVDILSGENGIYPSRSEMIRDAIKEFIMREFPFLLNISDDKNYQDAINDIMKNGSLQIQMNTRSQLPQTATITENKHIPSTPNENTVEVGDRVFRIIQK